MPRDGEKNIGHEHSVASIRLVRDSNPKLCNTGATLYQLSQQANWVQVIELVRHKPVKGWRWDNEYMKIICRNCWVRKWMKEDHRSFRRIMNHFDNLLLVGFLALHRYHGGQGFESRTRLNFFRLSFRNCKVAFLTAMVVFHLILHSAVPIYDFRKHVFIISIFCLSGSSVYVVIFVLLWLSRARSTLGLSFPPFCF